MLVDEKHGDFDRLMMSCFACKTKFRIRSTHEGKLIHCPSCKDRMLVMPDDAPKRKIEVWFSRSAQKGESSIDRIIRYIAGTQRTLDIAIYSLTHDWLREPFKEALNRKVKIRIVIDKQQAGLPDADDEYYEELGIEVRRDCLSGLMHHKFAIRDGEMVLTGSYNWTKSAGEKHRENFLLIREQHVIDAYQQEFDSLWAENDGSRLRQRVTPRRSSETSRSSDA